MEDAYLTLAAPASGEFRDRGSKFLAYAFPAATEAEWQLHLETVKKEHPKARHHCYAYRLGLDGNNYRANDDGEPSGTAGRPILGQIDSKGLTNVLVVVVRYFGGTLLGTSGLIHAYKTSTQAALEASQVVEKIVGESFRLSFDYGLMGELMNSLKKLDIEIQRQEFGDAPLLEISIRKSQVERTILELKASLLKVSLEEASTIAGIPGLRIIPLPAGSPLR